MIAGASAQSSRFLTALFDVTNRCNIRCRMCYYSDDSVFHRRPEFRSPEDFERIASQVLPRAHTAYLSTGSEPLVSPHFAEILAIAQRYAPLRTKALTNGLLLTPELDDALIEHELDELHVSVDGACAETYEAIRRGGRFDRLVANLTRLSQRKHELGGRGPTLQFNVTLMRSNPDELVDFVPLAERLGVERIACRHLMPYVGLGLETETTDRDPLHANECFARFLDRATDAGIAVTNFPDFFRVDGAAWLPPIDPARDVDGVTPIDGAIDGSRDDGPPVVEAVEGVARLTGWVRIGTAVQHNGARPDIQLDYARYPQAWRAAWSFELPAADVPEEERDDVLVRAVAVDPSGRRRPLGLRRVRFTRDGTGAPFRFCRKPFETIYVNSSGDVFPYPDCHTLDPIGSLLGDERFDEMWSAPRMQRLRKQIEDRDPPTMCLTCPDFINRNPDDPAYFTEREVESALRRPTGYLDAPTGRVAADGETLLFRGWALGFSPVTHIEVQRDATDEERLAGSDGLVTVATIEPGTVERPDVAAVHRRYPNSTRAGFEFALRTSELASCGAVVHLRVVARTEAGDEAILGSVTVETADAEVKPLV